MVYRGGMRGALSATVVFWTVSQWSRAPRAGRVRLYLKLTLEAEVVNLAHSCRSYKESPTVMGLLRYVTSIDGTEQHALSFGLVGLRWG